MARALVLSAFLVGVGALAPASIAAAEQASPQVREIEITVENGAYKPARISAREGEKVRLKFVRKEYSSCTKEVVFPTLNIKRELPTNKAVLIELPELKAGEIAFACGMNMVKGSVVVEAKK